MRRRGQSDQLMTLTTTPSRSRAGGHWHPMTRNHRMLQPVHAPPSEMLGESECKLMRALTQTSRWYRVEPGRAEIYLQPRCRH